MVCPQDLTTTPRPEESCPSGADPRDVALTFVAPQAHTPTGAEEGAAPPANDSGLVAVPANLTVLFDVLSTSHPDVATMYQYHQTDGAGASNPGSRGGMLPTSLEWQGAPVRVADSLGRLLVSPTPARTANTAARFSGAGTYSETEALPGSPSVALRYRACVAEDGTCTAAVGSAEVDINRKPDASNTERLITAKGVQSEPFRLAGGDSDSTDLLYVITSLPSDLLAKGATKYCNIPNPPPSVTCAGVILPSSGLGYCSMCTLLCSGGPRCLPCDDPNLSCPEGQTAVPYPMIYYQPLTCESCAGRPVETIKYRIHDGLQFSPEVSVEFHVNTPPVAENYLLVPEVIPRVAADCDGDCVADCDAACTRSCVEYAALTKLATPGACESANLSGECDKIACLATCEDMRCEGRAFAQYNLKGSDEDGDPITVQILSVPSQLVDIGGGSIAVQSLGKVYQTVKSAGETSFARIQDLLGEGLIGTWGIVKDKNGLVKFVPDRGTQGRPYGGNNGALQFKVLDGYAQSDNLGSVYVAVNSIPTVAASSASIAEGANTTFTLMAEDAADCNSGYCGRLPDGSYTGQMKAVITTISPTGDLPGLFIAPPVGSPDESPAVLRCHGAGGACAPPVDIGGVRVLYVPPLPVDPAVNLAPPGLEATKGVLSISFKADDGELMLTAVATSTITTVPKPRAPDLLFRIPSLIPRNLSGRVPNSATEYYDGVTPVPTRVPLWPTAATFAACGDQSWTERDRIYSMLYSLPVAGTGTLFAITAPSEGWFDEYGEVIEPPIKAVSYQAARGFQQVNPDFEAEANIDNTLRQVLYEPVAVAHDATAGYNASFLYRVCVVELRDNGQSRGCAEYSDFAKVTMVVVRQNQPPTATAPPAVTLREGMDATHGVTLTLLGTDPENGTDVVPAVVRPPGVSASCGDGSESCGTLYQVNFAGEPGDAFSAAECTYATPCFVTDPHRRVIFIPAVNGRDGSGPSNPAYCTVQFVVSDGELLSVPADVTVRVNAAPTVPATIRRVFVDEDSGGVLPMDMLASDTDGDVLTFYLTAMTGSTSRPEFFDVDFNHTLGYDPSTARRGRALSTSDLPQSLTAGSPRVWFEPRPNTTGNLTGCCSKRWGDGKL